MYNLAQTKAGAPMVRKKAKDDLSARKHRRTNNNIPSPSTSIISKLGYSFHCCNHMTSAYAMPYKKKQAAIPITHQEIQEHIEDFLKSGGKITEVPCGASGRPSIKDLKESTYGKTITNFLS